EDDAVKNSVTMAAQSVYSDRELHGKHSGDKQEMLWQRGINWNDYPPFFKRGVYLKRITTRRTLTDEELRRIPEAHRPDPGELFDRSSVVELDLPPIRRCPDAMERLFGVKREERE